MDHQESEIKQESNLLLNQKNGHTIKQEDYIAGLAKGLAVLECFDSGRSRLSVTQAAERAGLTRAAARRHLRTLHFLGYLDSDGTLFWLTPKVLKPAAIYISTATLPKIARSVLRDLSEQSGCYHSVVILEGSEAVTVASSYPLHLAQAQVLPYGIYSGNRIPAHSGANGKVLLAALSDAALQQWLADYELVRFTAQTLTNPAALCAVLEEVRQQGWALAAGEFEPGFGGLAVPVFNAQGKVVAALNAVDHLANIHSLAWQNRMLSLLQQAALAMKVML